jgi:hypothetical protein
MNWIIVRVSRPGWPGRRGLCGGLLPFAVFMVLSFFKSGRRGPPGFLLSNRT